MNTRQDEGFSAVELLVTLLIGSLFLIAGYQLYAQVLRDGYDTNKFANVSNLAYDKMRIEADTANQVCANNTNKMNETATPPQGIKHSSTIQLLLVLAALHH